MDPLDLTLHLFGFLAPALAVGWGIALAHRFILARQSQGGSWWAQGAINSIAGAAVLVAGLWYFGVDGKMATYAGLVLATATSQWLCARAWKA